MTGEHITQHPGMRWADRAYPSLPMLRPSNHGEQVIYHLPLQPARGGPARHIHLLPDRCEGWRVTAGGAKVRRRWVNGIPKKRLAAQLGLDPKTVPRYVNEAENCGVRLEDGLAGLTDELSSAA